MTTKLIQTLTSGKTVLGIELGSTNIKAVLLDEDFSTVASGSYGWENSFVDGNWTYALDEVWTGIQSSYAALRDDVKRHYGISLHQVGAVGISAMMHGYLAFDAQGRQLVPFRTWRNNTTAQAATELSEVFGFNIPQRWSIAHFYQAILNHEAHIHEVDFLTTLAGYVHWQLSGQKCLGIGDASGMFPIEEATHDYDVEMVSSFEQLMAAQGLSQRLIDILPRPLIAGVTAGHLSQAGAQLLDPSGELKAGAVMAPPEGDAGTGMVGTNAVRKRTGTISAGTSAFSMIVLDQPLERQHRDIDIVATPSGALVAMVHANNCSSDLNAWVGVFNQFAVLLGKKISPDKLYSLLLGSSAEGNDDAGGLLNYAYLSGENVTSVEAGRPLFMRTPNSQLTLANFFKCQLYSAFAPLKIGNDILAKQEHIITDVMVAQGGIFRTPRIAQQILADALNTPITVMANAGVGGPWGMAVLASYVLDPRGTVTLADYLDKYVFQSVTNETVSPNPSGVAGYDTYLQAYQEGIGAEIAGASVQDYANWS